jgi:Uma2 family endonuclease
MNVAYKLNKEKYTYADYLRFDDDKRLEIIDGNIYLMSTAPRRIHQEISMNLSILIGSFLKGKECSVYTAPFDVRLFKENTSPFKIENVIQPDISIICDKSKLDDKGCLGSPDWIIEILSPATSKMDVQLKYDLYERFGVREYWIVEPTDGIILVYKLDENGKYFNSDRYAKGDMAKTIFDDLLIDLGEVFEDIQVSEEKEIEQKKSEK